MFDDIDTVSLWELSCERKVRNIRTRSRVQVTVQAIALSEAVAKTVAELGDEWIIWSARHLGYRKVIFDAPSQALGEEKPK